MKKITNFLFSFIQQQWILILLLLIHIFLRFYKIETYNVFGWDQVDNAWASVNILIHHRLTLVGMVAKGNSGIYIGPAYYYLIAAFYYIFNFDPFASGVFATVTSLLGFFSIYFVTKNLFSKKIAYIAVFLNAASFASIYFDRIQWPVDLIPGVSLLIFYTLYKVVTGNSRFILYLALLVGFSFHIHFTAIFFPLYILCCLPFFPRTMQTIKYTLFSIPVFGIWLLPSFVAILQNSHAQAGSFIKYGDNYYHGFHLRRFFQLANDAFIEFEPYLLFPFLKFLKFVLLPLFSFILYLQKPRNGRVLLIYLFLLWFIIPWIVFATYSGEITEYYFSVTRYLIVIIFAYLLFYVYSIKTIIPKITVISLVLVYLVCGIYTYFTSFPTDGGGNKNISEYRDLVRKDIIEGTKVEYKMGDPESLMYYLETRNKNK